MFNDQKITQYYLSVIYKGTQLFTDFITKAFSKTDENSSILKYPKNWTVYIMNHLKIRPQTCLEIIIKDKKKKNQNQTLCPRYSKILLILPYNR